MTLEERCRHRNVLTEVQITGFNDDENKGVAEIAIHCEDCGRPLVFDGIPVGVSVSRPMTGILGEVRMPFHWASDAEQEWIKRGSGS